MRSAVEPVTAFPSGLSVKAEVVHGMPQTFQQTAPACKSDLWVCGEERSSDNDVERDDRETGFVLGES